MYRSWSSLLECWPLRLPLTVSFRRGERPPSTPYGPCASNELRVRKKNEAAACRPPHYLVLHLSGRTLTFLLRPDRGEAVLARDAVAVDQLQPVSLAYQLVEGRLVLRGCQAMAGLPGRDPGDLPEDCGVAILHTIAVAANQHRLVAFAHELVEDGLVLRGCESMPGLPGRGARRL